MAKSKKKRKGLFPIYEINQSQDWQLKGYYNNYMTAAQYVPRDKLVSFTTPAVAGIKTVAPTQIIARKLLLKGDQKTILSSTDYAVTMSLITEDGETQYYFNQQTLSGSYLDDGCFYEIYIEDADGNKFLSNIFIAIEESEIELYLEDGQQLLLEDGQTLIL